jgi:protein-tyrosine phosphatase
MRSSWEANTAAVRCLQRLSSAISAAPSAELEMKIVLFLCTGNYYRSRFAEELFNHRAAVAGADWRAQSRALAIERGTHNVGPLSPFALHGLSERGIAAKGAVRFPQQCMTVDLQNADRVVALDETEHRPLMRERFADWEHRIHYWGIADVELVKPHHALSLIEAQIDALLAELGTIGGSPDARRASPKRPGIKN